MAEPRFELRPAARRPYDPDIPDEAAGFIGDDPRAGLIGNETAIVADDRGHGGAGPPVVMFHYAPGRGAVHALRFLEGYRGHFVQCDGYEAYDKLTKVDRPVGPWTLVHCWTHARRRFVKRLEKDGSPIAEEALRQIAELVTTEEDIATLGLPDTAEAFRDLKAMGFSDKRLATLAVRSVGVAGGLGETQAKRSGLLHDALRAMAGATSEEEVRKLRRKLGVYPLFKRIDRCAAEFEAITPYMYSTYEAPSFGEAEDEADPSDRKKIVILGGGPNRIGQGIEFDYCCVHACFALAEAGFETITFVTAMDHMDADGAVKGQRFEVCYQFLSLAHGDRVRLLLGVDEENPKAPTATKAFAGAAFMERECFDMFGIVFEGHDNLRRLLMPEAFEHYPLRKDFPHRGIEPDKLYNQWNRERGGAPS